MLNEWRFCKYNNFIVSETTFIKKSKNVMYANEIVALDTETSHNHNEENPVAWIYQWCFSFQKQLIYGRTPSQFIEALKKIKNELELSKEKQLVIYVHNLSYDIQYLKDFLIDSFGSDYDLLALSPHKFISFTIDCFCFKCSYKLSNKSLAKFSKDLNTKHRKLVGEIDYDMIRNQIDPLYKKDWKYMFYDVVVLHEAIEKQLENENDTLATIPLTSTGYVRRDGRNSARKDKKHHDFFLKTALDETTYSLCRNAFMGGLTHGNMYYADKTVNGKIFHFDFTSHYPTQQRVKKFPMSKFNLLGNNLSLSDIEKYSNNACMLIDIIFKDLQLKSKSITLPYVSESKVRLNKSSGSRIIADNGRLLKMTGYTELVLTELDLDIVLDQYTFTAYNVVTCYIADADYLPQWFCDFVDKFFREKSDYKYTEKQLMENNGSEVDILEAKTNLMKSKNRLNGIYGMTATDIVRNEIKMDVYGQWTVEPCNVSEALEKYYKSRNKFLPYQWGVWTTAHARHELVHIVKDIIGYDNFLYCDTDSAFFIDESGDIRKRIEEENKKWREEAENMKFYVDTLNGKSFYHSFEDEKETIKSFRFLHSKCYAYITDDEKLHCTIAGVREFANGTSRVKELGSIDNLKSGKVFYKCGGTRALYVENAINNDENERASSCIILPVTKTLDSNIEYQLQQYESED